MLDKFRQGGEFFSAIEVVKITRILDFNVSYNLAIPSVMFFLKKNMNNDSMTFEFAIVFISHKFYMIGNNIDTHTWLKE